LLKTFCRAENLCESQHFLPAGCLQYLLMTLFSGKNCFLFSHAMKKRFKTTDKMRLHAVVNPRKNYTVAHYLSSFHGLRPRCSPFLLREAVLSDVLSVSPWSEQWLQRRADCESDGENRSTKLTPSVASSFGCSILYVSSSNNHYRKSHRG